MFSPSAAVFRAIRLAALALATMLPGFAQTHVTYEEFGAVGDGVADDLPAIVKAHAHANDHDLPVKSNPKATYHLGRRALTATVQTDTDWSTSRFIIDDSMGVDDPDRPLFQVTSKLKRIPLKIDRLTRGQDRLDVLPPMDCHVHVENSQHRIFIRRGGNRNNGTVQQEAFILRRDGTIEGAIDWDYEAVTKVVAAPIDPQRLMLRGGIFTNIANRDTGTSYWARNIRIRRSNTGVSGIVQKVTGETEVGAPYEGFLSASGCANLILHNCRIDGRKVYHKIGSAGSRVAMGSYGYSANGMVNFRMTGCRMDDIHDRSRWGVIGTNFMKNILLEDCELSRMDVHQGVSGDFFIRRTKLGHQGLNAIGRGRLFIEDSTLHGSSLISFRDDYGATWEGEVLIRNSRWITPRSNAVMFGTKNDGTHDFGYPCFMPRLIRIEGLVVEDSNHGSSHKGITFFADPLNGSKKERPYPVRLTERLEVSGLKTTSGLPPRVSQNPEVEQAIEVVFKDGR